MMFVRTSAALVTAALLAGHAAAKTDLSGCVSSQTVAYGGASLIWYVPGTGEICEFLDCGGGRAPPKTTVPGCAGYEGTATYSPSYLTGFGGSGASATSSSNSVEVTPTDSSSSGAASASSSSSSSSSEQASITPPPVTRHTSTPTASSSEGTQPESSSDAPSSSSASSAAGSNAPSSSTSSVSTGGAALPTAAIKGAIGAMAGLAAGVAML
ncbi:hypothetical protein F5Y14DRAFT_216696 [Nemania sp. NC0429]|nr:hypothetical protein F5Y14DRAFT_216696 [Nemania sp. NC0429]